MLERVKNFCKQETVLCAAIMLALVSSFFATPQLAYIDFSVLSILFSLMLVVGALKSIRFLDWVAVELVNRCQSMRQIVYALVGITYVSSMFVTNDVALLTFVPLALVVGRKLEQDFGRVIILQTLAANLGSMLTPPGNPQNLFLYAYFDYTTAHFFYVMLLPGILSVIYIYLLIIRRHDYTLSISLPSLPEPPRKLTLLFLGLLFLNIGAVLQYVDKFMVLAVTAVVICIYRHRLLCDVDYTLLVTFIGFFVFIGNISHTALAAYVQQSFLGTAAGTYLTGLIASQFISNVPAAMLLAGMTNEADALLLGVNIGGLGTLIASMASVISYKLFIAEHPYQAGTYLRTFLFYNFAGLIILGGITYGVYMWL